MSKNLGAKNLIKSIDEYRKKALKDTTDYLLKNNLPTDDETIKKELILKHDVIKHNSLLLSRSEYVSFKNAKTKIIIDNPKIMNCEEPGEEGNSFKIKKFDHDPLRMFKKLSNVQQIILDRIDKLKLRGSYVFTASCGAGKTRAGMKIMEQLGVKTLIISSRNSVNDQWLKELKTEYPRLDIEKRLDDKKSSEEFIKQADVYIMTPQYIIQNFITDNLTKYQNMKIDLIIYDELHSLTSAEFGKVLLLPFLMKQYNILNHLPLLVGMTATIPKKDSDEFTIIRKIFGNPIESVDNIRDIRVDFTDYRDTQKLGKFDSNYIPLDDREAAIKYLQFMLEKGFNPTPSRKLLIITSTIDSSVFAAIQAAFTFQKPVLLIRAANEKSIFIKDPPDEYQYISDYTKASEMTDDDPDYTINELRDYKKKYKDRVIDCNYLDFIKNASVIIGTYHRLLEGFNCKEFVWGICTKFIWSPLKRVQLLGRIRRSSDDPELNNHKRLFFVNSGKIPTDLLNPNRIRYKKQPEILYDEEFEQRLFTRENYHRIKLDEIDESYL